MSYANGKPGVEPNSPEELDLAIAEWAEGNSHLEGALKSCINNGVQTFACCAGHRGDINGNDPYLSVIMTEENKGTVLNIMNQLYSQKSGIQSIGMDFLEKDGQIRQVISFHMKMGKRDKMFDIIEVAARDSIEKSEVSPLVSQMMELHEVAERTRLRHSFAYINLGFMKIFNIYGSTAYMLQEMYEDMKLSRGIAGGLSKNFINDAGIISCMARSAERLEEEFAPRKQPKSAIDELRERFSGVTESSVQGSRTPHKEKSADRASKSTLNNLDEI